MAADSRIPVWLDCDPGHDDAFAIILAAFHPNLRLLGVSTVFGNAPLINTTYNALSILTAISKQNRVAVYPGASRPLKREPLHAADIHGESGLDGTSLLPKPGAIANTTVSAIDAASAALRSCPPGTAWIVATGCLTNIATLLMAHSDVAQHIAGISIMGGAVGNGFTNAFPGVVDGKPRIGNTTPWAEFNIAIDPEAADLVFGMEALRPKIILVPLDVTHLVTAGTKEQELLLYGPTEPSKSRNESQSRGAGARGKTVLRTMLVELLVFFGDMYSKEFGFTNGPPLHDPLAVAALLTGVTDEAPFQDDRERYDVKVVTAGTSQEALAGKAQTGRTVLTALLAGQKGMRISRKLDVGKFWCIMEQCIEAADRLNADEGLT